MATNFLLKRSGTASKRPEAASMALGELDLNYDASTGGIFYKDSAGGVVKVGPAQVGSTAPNASPAGSAGNSVGEFWYDTGASALKIWDGSVWVATGGGGGGGGVTSISGTAPITVDNTNPATPIVGVTAASTTAAGVVQLVNSAGSLSCTLAPTANIVRLVNATAVAAIPCSRITAKGSLIVGAGPSSPTNLSVGTNGQVLTACADYPLGVFWASGGGGGGSPATPTAAGIVFGCMPADGLGNSALGYSVIGGGGLTGSQNTVVGGNAGYALTSGSENTLIGSIAGWCGTSASCSTAVGVGALGNNTTGNDNTAIGGGALGSVVTGSRNIGIGHLSGQSYTGSGSVIIGTVSPLSATDNEQLMIGSGCGRQWLAGDCTGAIRPMYGIRDVLESTGTSGQILSSTGTNSLCWIDNFTSATPGTEGVVYASTSTLNSNTALGYCALGSGNTGSNVAVGQFALMNLTGVVGSNVGVGMNAMLAATAAENNTALGASALGSNLTGCNNTAVGHGALYYITGNDNIGIGPFAGGVYSGNCSIFIGGTGTPSTSDDCQLIVAQPGVSWIKGYSNGSIKFGGGIIDAGDSCGTAGQVLTSSGANSYTWCNLPAAPTGATGTFTSQEGCTITVTNGLITSIV